VARAYLELEHQGFIYKRHGQGTYVCTPVLGAARRERNRMIAGLFEKAISEAVNFGMSASEITEIYDQMMRRYELETV
jgi:DNA-binding transcriptional regulator YhcF (GntR family)